MASGVLSSDDRIELLDSVHFAGKSVQVEIVNVGDKRTVYDLTHEPAESAISYRGGNTSPFPTPLLEDDEAIVTFSSSKVTVRAGKSVSIKVRFQEPSTGLASEFPFYSGYIVATPRIHGAVPVRLPYAGIKGDLSKVPILDTDAGFPSLTIYNKTSGESKPAKKGYKINWDDERPQIHTRLGSHTPELCEYNSAVSYTGCCIKGHVLRLTGSIFFDHICYPSLAIRLYDDATGEFVGYLDTPSGIAAGACGRDRDLFPNGKRFFQTADWVDGKIYAGLKETAIPAPAGKYKVVVAAQRKFSKGVYPEDFEVYEVAVITI